MNGLFFIGSADWMVRNLESRVEAITPVESRPFRERLWEILQLSLSDQRQAWDMHPDGSYVQRSPGKDPEDPANLGVQQILMERTRQRNESNPI